jgi:hypothetical protein
MRAAIAQRVRPRLRDRRPLTEPASRHVLRGPRGRVDRVGS